MMVMMMAIKVAEIEGGKGKRKRIDELCMSVMQIEIIK